MFTLLFVYLGEPPEYVFENLTRTRSLFPHAKIAFCGDLNPPQNWLRRNQVEFIRHTPDAEFERLRKSFETNQDFRNGYWRYTVERLIAITNYHEEFPSERILHVEADVLLLPNFPLEAFSKIDKLAWLGYGQKADIASILYSPNIGSSRAFRNAILNEIDNGNVIDMEILFSVRQNCQVELLPVSNSRESDIGSLKSKYFKGDVASIDSQEIFSGIFDSASIGIWLTGQDPRNRFGITRVRTMELVEKGLVQVDPSKVAYKLDESGNLFLIDNYKNCIPIYNLHIHSKELNLFRSTWLKHLSVYINIKGVEAKFIRINFRILASLLKDNIKQGTLIRFILHIPILNELRVMVSKLRKILNK